MMMLTVLGFNDEALSPFIFQFWTNVIKVC
jgi:hypothetical protein